MLIEVVEMVICEEGCERERERERVESRTFMKTSNALSGILMLNFHFGFMKSNDPNKLVFQLDQ